MKKKLWISTALLLAVGLLTALAAGMLSVTAAGAAPVAENLELDTYRGVSVGGRLSASDPDGEALVYEVTTDPVKGKLDVDEDGRFVYTPADGKRGKDYFGYRAVDSEGNRSQEATVIIRILKQKSKVNYADTAGMGSAYAAVRLAEAGVFTGECLGGEYVFSPERPVTREEFLTMCMLLTGDGVLTGARTTGFADDADIETWAKPYVSTALRRGFISGYVDRERGVVFGPDQNITAAEAAVLLDRVLDLTDAVAAWYSYDDAAPAWARQAAGNIAACGLLPAGVSFTDQTLSRGETAEMLSAAMDLLARR